MHARGPRLLFRFPHNKLDLMFNHYRDNRSSGKFQKIWCERDMSAERPLTTWSPHLQKTLKQIFK